MRTSFKRFLSLIMALLLMFALGTATFAADDERVPKDASSDSDVVVFFPPGSDLSLKVGEKTTVEALVENAGSKAIVDWYCSDDSVVSIKGSGRKVTVTAVGPGEAIVTLEVARADGKSSDSDYFHVEVKSAAKPISVSGGGSVTMSTGESKKLTAKVSGGSGQYDYEWESSGEAVVDFGETSYNSAVIYADRPGNGTVFLTVTDAMDRNNNMTVMWDLTVKNSKPVKAPSITLSRGSIDLGVGASGSISAAVTDGSGNYEFYWKSDNSRVVSVNAHGEFADIYASDTPIPGARNSAVISVYAKDVETGLSSNTATCTVHVTGNSTVYDAYANVKVGDHYSMNVIAKEMSTVSQVDFGKKIDYSASVRLSATSSNAGSLRFQDGTIVRAGTNYTFASFQDMIFNASAAGSFVVDYMITDGGNTMTGIISIGVEGNGRGVESVSLSPKSIKMPTFANEYLTLSVTPSYANYEVAWDVTGPLIVTVIGNGSRVTLKSNGYVGSTQVTATVFDANGKTKTAVCNVTVEDQGATYDTSLTLTLGSDYYGSKLADSMSSKFKSAFGVYPGDNAEIYFTSLGSGIYGEMHLRDGSPVYAKRSYTFRQWIDMYFTPYAKGTYPIDYELTYKGNTMRGNIKVIIEAASLAVNINPTSMRLAPYSNQYISVDISPASAYYRISWVSSNPYVATVTGSNTTAVVNSLAPGTTTITAVVTDANGIEIRRGCTVIVDSSETVFNPSVSTTIGTPYVGTGTSSAMRSQFSTLYGFELADSAIIRFASAGNIDVGVMRLADGTMIKPNTDYSLGQYVAMYTEPVSAGTYSVPYTLSYSGKTLSGTVSVVINPASISTNFSLPANAAYSFSDPMNDSTGAAVFAGSITNAVGSNWSYLSFGSTSTGAGTLYLDRSGTAIQSGASITAAAMKDLYFVPGELNGAFHTSYTVYNAAGKVLGAGTLSISRPGGTFADVPADAFYAQAVNWAVGRGITSGTGGNNFSPDMFVTRGQAVTFLWRAAGQPKAIAASNPFTDVAAGAYYYDAVLWAVQQGITNGTSETTFSPDNQLNRDQLLTFLCRANGGYAGGADWSKLAVDWATARGLLAGIPGTFVANAACPRSEVVYYLWKNYNG